MLKPQKTSKRLLIKLAVLLGATLISSGCATPGGLPAPPKGNLYLHDLSANQALCTELNTGIPCRAVPMSQTDVWYMLPPEDFEALTNYIDKLITRLEAATTPMAAGGAGAAIPVYKSDLRKGKSILQKADQRLKRQL